MDNTIKQKTTNRKIINNSIKKQQTRTIKYLKTSNNLLSNINTLIKILEQK